MPHLPWRSRCGYTPLARGWGISFRHYGDFCTSTDTNEAHPEQLGVRHFPPRHRGHLRTQRRSSVGSKSSEMAHWLRGRVSVLRLGIVSSDPATKHRTLSISWVGVGLIADNLF